MRKKRKEFARIQDKQMVYHVDVELDQLLTSFRLSFANILAFLAKEILDGTPVEMNTLIQSILFFTSPPNQYPELRKSEQVTLFSRNNSNPSTNILDLIHSFRNRQSMNKYGKVCDGCIYYKTFQNVMG